MSMTKRQLLIVFEGEGTLWWRPTGKETATSEDVVRKGPPGKQGKQVLQLRPGLREVLGKIVEAGHAIAIWSNESSQRENSWLNYVLGSELRAKLLFTWYSNRSTVVGTFKVKESSQVMATFPDFGYNRTVFVDHDYMSHSLSLPGNLLLVRRFSGQLLDIFLESWVWEMVTALEEFLEVPEQTVPQFFLHTKRPQEQALVEEMISHRGADLNLARGLKRLVTRECKKFAPDAEKLRKEQEDILDVEFPNWRDRPYNDTNMDNIVPVIPGERNCSAN